MEKEIYKIILHDGTQISNLRMNGDNFISSTRITEDMFQDNLASVTITGGEMKEVHGPMELVQITQTDGEYWFVLRDITEAELQQAQLRADLDYIAMMTDVKL